jgi:hypothetical protein
VNEGENISTRGKPLGANPVLKKGLWHIFTFKISEKLAIIESEHFTTYLC